ncbi:FtsK/SpoIIIE domain-containing protein [Allobaculum sp. Allo2]|uniref:FtsK/SpoIIIE domain-containing protein n=1 Tax=Allobaculum sp. Allo2 TaxID=2853432 RepID=UPI001F612CC8|nr:FtsK/SpoIIIE domain-containing protein [Allobaculum sp. Allo2]
MTGSGKSEFIISYVLSLAVNYHPYEVSFILIDFKGGGLTGAFVDPQRGIKLPHVAGTITNLDESTMNRALASIESELKRRQKIFNEAKSIANEGTMDIYGYQQLYRRGVVSEPVSHLLIISDEFAELNDQHPEFLDQLVSTARIGRSLGVHLILATQKPAGVVTGQIKSNTKFRVSLKVQDRSDSNDMINRPYAAEIKETGRFYMLVGYDEYFAMGQSAWTGAEYKPSDEAQSSENKEILFSIPMANRILKPSRFRPDGKRPLAARFLSDLFVRSGQTEGNRSAFLMARPAQSADQPELSEAAGRFLFGNDRSDG